jgi:hypothetical protein
MWHAKIKDRQEGANLGIIDPTSSSTSLYFIALEISH